MYWKGIDINSKDKNDWNKALDVLKEQKNLLQGYVNDEVFNKMESDSAAIAPYYAGDYLTMYSQNDKLAFYYPKEGTNYFVDAMCIPKSSKNPYLAMEYINFMLGVEDGEEESSAAIANALYIGYATPNKAVKENKFYIETLTSEDWYGENAVNILYGADPVTHNESYAKKIGKSADEVREAPCYKSFTPEMQEYVNELWEQLKTYSAIELWIHIVCAIIVIGVLTLAIYTTTVKKIRSKDYRLRDKMLKKQKESK
jgi:spermidine/putrescine-binding protein